MGKKASRGLAGSLGFRILSVSFLFLAIPLVVYSGVLYLVDYRQYVRNLFEELDLIAEEEVSWIKEKQTTQENTLSLIQEFVGNFDLTKNEFDHDELTVILKKFIKHEDISAIAYNKVTASGQIICQRSTSSIYQGVDFSKYFSLDDLKKLSDNVFIAKDPVFGYSMYVIEFIKEKGEEDAIVMSIISLEKLLSKIVEFQNISYLNVSIVSPEGRVIVTTNKEYVGKSFSHKDKSGSIVLHKVGYAEKGLTFSFNGKKHLADIRQIPKSTTYLVVSAPKYVVMQRFVTFLFELGAFLLVVIIVGGIATYLFTLRMAKPMTQLNKVMSTVGSGKLDIEYVPDRYGFEINHLGESFNQMRVNLLAYIEEVQKERGMKEAFEKELQIGHQIQKALLPSEEAHIDGVEIKAYYSPAKEVAGDFYDYLVLDENRVLITIADGVGKGISSCLYSFDLRSILKTAALENRPLDELVIRTNSIFCSDTKESCNFVTLVTGVLDKKEKTFEFTDAGHLPVMVKKKNNGVELHSTKGIALGIEEFKEVEVKKITIEAGDFLVLYTDGVTEAQNGNKELYTENRLKETIESFNGDSAEALTNLIMDRVHAFVGDVEQYDDITLVVFRLQ